MTDWPRRVAAAAIAVIAVVLFVIGASFTVNGSFFVIAAAVALAGLAVAVWSGGD